MILSSLNWLLFLGGVFLLTWAEARGTPDYQFWVLVVLLAGTVAGQFVAAYRWLRSRMSSSEGLR